jgi:hypothetical protein
LPAGAWAHESPVDHVTRTLRLWVGEGRLHLEYRLQISERAALVQLHRMDADQDGVISDVERDTYFGAEARRLAGKLQLAIDDRPVSLLPERRVRLDPQLGQTFTFAAPLAGRPPGRHPARLVDQESRFSPGPFRIGTKGSAVALQPPDPPAGDLKHPALIAVRFAIIIPESGQR